MSVADTNPPAEGSGNPLGRLARRYAAPYRQEFGVGIITQALGRVPELLPPLLIGIAIDSLILQEEPYALPLVPDAWLPETQFWLFVLTFALLALSYPTDALFDYVSRLALGRFDQRVQHDVRTDVYDTVQRLEMGFFDETETGEVMSILNDDVRELQAFVWTLSQVVRFGTFAVVAYAYLFWIHWQLTLVLLVVPLTLGVMSYWFSDRMEPKHLAIRERVGTLNSRLNNNLGGISVIKSFGTEDRERERVRSASRDHYEAQWDAQRTRATIDPAMYTVSRSAQVLVLLVGGYWVLRGPPLFFSGDLGAGALFSMWVYVGGLVTPMQGLASSVDGYQNGKAAATRVAGIVQAESVADRNGSAELDDPDGRVEYEDVSFTYPGRDESAVDDVTLTVEPGETVGVVGPTGAGKSTLLKLLFRFYEPDRGSIAIDGHGLEDVTVESLRSSIGYVSQEPFLFSGTVRENIAYSRTDLEEEAIVRAAKLAGAHEFVEDLPEGYDTTVGERGVKLSGGQRQRLSIARAIVREPRLLVLDEATSHVDNETEVLIQRSLEELAADRTTFVVAHRLSTVRDADRIFVIDDGAVVERDTHEELLERDGLYANLWRVQVGDVDALPEAFLERIRRQEEVA